MMMIMMMKKKVMRNLIIIMIKMNTEKSPGHLRRLAVSHTPVKDHQLTLVWESRKKNSHKRLKKYIECKKRDRYLDLARELKKLWNIKMTVIPIVNSGLKDLKVRGQLETILTIALLR